MIIDCCPCCEFDACSISANAQWQSYAYGHATPADNAAAGDDDARNDARTRLRHGDDVEWYGGISDGAWTTSTTGNACGAR